MLLHSNSNLLNRYKKILNDSNEIIIFSPYIKKNALEELISTSTAKVSSIITSWKPIDIASGVTDIDVYEICQKNDIQLLINNRIHLKSIVLDNFSSCTVSSSNITNRGLALGRNYNFELGTFVESLALEDKCYFDTIIDEAFSVTDEYYTEIKKQVDDLPNNLKEIPENFSTPELSERKYLTSMLPYCDNPEMLFDIVSNQEDYSEDEVRSVFHDLKLYNIEDAINKEHLRRTLKKGFHKHYFIKDFLEYNGEGRYFGELTVWLHDRIENVPCPKRFEVKEYLQRIFAYIEYLLQDEYRISVPKRHSQFLKRINI